MSSTTCIFDGSFLCFHLAASLNGEAATAIESTPRSTTVRNIFIFSIVCGKKLERRKDVSKINFISNCFHCIIKGGERHSMVFTSNGFYRFSSSRKLVRGCAYQHNEIKARPQMQLQQWNFIRIKWFVQFANTSRTIKIINSNRREAFVALFGYEKLFIARLFKSWPYLADSRFHESEIHWLL